MENKIEPPVAFNSLKQVADYYGVSRSSIVLALRKKKLQGRKVGPRWLILREDMNTYRIHRYSRHALIHKGEFVYDEEKGFLSIKRVAELFTMELGFPYRTQRIYYLIRLGALKASQKGAAWVVNREDAMQLLDREKQAHQTYLINSKRSEA